MLWVYLTLLELIKTAVLGLTSIAIAIGTVIVYFGTCLEGSETDNNDMSTDAGIFVLAPEWLAFGVAFIVTRRSEILGRRTTRPAR